MQHDLVTDCEGLFQAMKLDAAARAEFPALVARLSSDYAQAKHDLDLRRAAPSDDREVRINALEIRDAALALRDALSGPARAAMSGALGDLRPNDAAAPDAPYGRDAGRVLITLERMLSDTDQASDVVASIYEHDGRASNLGPLYSMCARIRDFVAKHGGAFTRDFHDGVAQSDAAALFVTIAQHIDPSVTVQNADTVMRKVVHPATDRHF